MIVILKQSANGFHSGSFHQFERDVIDEYQLGSIECSSNKDECESCRCSTAGSDIWLTSAEIFTTGIDFNTGLTSFGVAMTSFIGFVSGMGSSTIMPDLVSTFIYS